MEYLYIPLSLLFFTVTFLRILGVSERFRVSNYSIKVFLRTFSKYNSTSLHKFKKISKVLGFILFIPASLHDSFMSMYHVFIICIFIIDLFPINRLYQKFNLTNFNRKDIFIIIPTSTLIFLLFLNPLTDYFFWIFILERINIFIYLFFAFCISFPYELYEDAQVEKIRKLIKNHSFLASVLVEGRDTKILIEHTYKLLSNLNSKVAKVYIDRSIGRLANLLLNSNKNNTEIIFIGVSIPLENVDQIIDTVRPQIMIKPFDVNINKLLSHSHNLIISLQNLPIKRKNRVRYGHSLNGEYEVLRFSFIGKGQIFNLNDIISIIISELKVTRNGIIFKLEHRKKHFTIQTGLIGINEVIATLPAVLLAIKVGINVKEIVRYFSKLQPIRGYMHPTLLISKSRIIDYSSAYLNSIETLLVYIRIFRGNKILFLNSNLFENESHANLIKFFSQIESACSYCIIFNNPTRYIFEKYVKNGLVKCKVVGMGETDLINFISKNLKTEEDIAIGMGKGAELITSKVFYKMSVDIHN